MTKEAAKNKEANTLDGKPIDDEASLETSLKKFEDMQEKIDGFDLTNEEELKEARALKSKIVTMRTSCDKILKGKTKTLKDKLAELKAKFEKTYERIEKVEQGLRDRIKAIDDEAKRLAQEAKERDIARIAEHKKNLNEINSASNNAGTLAQVDELLNRFHNMTPESFEEFEDEAAVALDTMRESLNAKKALLERQAAEAQRLADKEAEQQRIADKQAEERAALKRQKDEIAEREAAVQKEKDDRENARIDRLKNKIARIDAKVDAAIDIAACDKALLQLDAIETEDYDEFEENAKASVEKAVAAITQKRENFVNDELEANKAAEEVESIAVPTRVKPQRVQEDGVPAVSMGEHVTTEGDEKPDPFLADQELFQEWYLSLPTTPVAVSEKGQVMNATIGHLLDQIAEAITASGEEDEE